MPVPDRTEETPREFVEQVGEALRHLYDPVSLPRSPLVGTLVPADASLTARGLPQRRGQRLRALLLEAIEALSPGPRAAFRSVAARSYQAMHLHYVDAHTVDEVARLLALSQRQAYRDIRKGEADLAALLWQQQLARAALPEPSPIESAGRLLRQEVRRVPLRPADVSLQNALERAAEPLSGLLSRSETTLDLDLPQDHQVRVDEAALHRFLMAALSLVVQTCGGSAAGPARVRARAQACESEGEGEQVRLELAGAPVRPGGHASLANLQAVVRALAEALGGDDLQYVRDAERACLRVCLPVSPPAVAMVIDDNEGLTELLARYLGQAGYSVVEARDGSDGLSLARSRHPRVIILDVLMPGIDGWALLAQLKADPDTADIPVVVCSVFDDPELAQSLGAAAYIAKPVSKPTLLAALDEALG